MVEQGSCGVWLCMGRAGRQGLGRLGRGGDSEKVWQAGLRISKLCI